MRYKITGLSELGERDFESFQGAVHALISECFLVRGVEDHKKHYQFIMSNRELVESYLVYGGWGLRVDEASGVIAWDGPASNRANFTIDETLSLFVLRVLYEEKRHEISLREYPTVYQRDFHEKYQVMVKRIIRKTRFREILRRFHALTLIRLHGDETDPETQITLYPSLAIVIDAKTIDDISAKIESLDEDAGPEGPMETDTEDAL